MLTLAGRLPGPRASQLRIPVAPGRPPGFFWGLGLGVPDRRRDPRLAWDQAWARGALIHIAYHYPKSPCESARPPVRKARPGFERECSL